jgi:glycosyltransferase involved in cell wall biosynthesis
MKNLPTLTIAIPTFDRPNEILERFDEILPQIKDNHQTQLLVIDNHSCVSVDKIYTEKYGINYSRNVKIITNSSNVGLSANVCKCFENADGDWVWLLGDDDSVKKNAIELILNKISRVESQVSYINFSCGFHKNTENIIIKNTREYLDNIEKNKSNKYPVSNLVYISTGCYKREVFSDYIKTGYTFALSHCPHFAMLLAVLGTGRHSMMLCNDELVDWDIECSGRDWSRLRLILGSSYLADLEGNTNESLAVVRKLIYEFTPNNYSKWILKVVFGDSVVPMQFWCLFFSRMIILGNIKVKFYSMIYLTMLPLIANIKLRNLIAKLVEKKSIHISIGTDRL